jgi:hypothetical protein
MTATANGKPELGEVSVAPTGGDALGAIASQLGAELEQAQAARDVLVAHLAEQDKLVARLDGAMKALAGPVPRGLYKKKSGPGNNTALKNPDPALMELVEATIVRLGESASIPELMGEIQGRNENTVRRTVFTLRDEGRIRLVAAARGPKPARYAAMPEVAEEYAT